MRRAPLRLLVAAQVAAGTVLFAGAALLLFSLVRLTSVDPGFDAAHVFSFQVTLPAGRYEAAGTGAFAGRLASELAGLPGVRDVSIDDAPLGYDSIGFSPHIDGRPSTGPVVFRSVPPGFFRTLGMPIARGRGFVPADATASPRTAVVSQTFANQYFPGADAVGHRVSLQDWKDLEIVGVTSDTRAGRPDAHVDPQLYVPVDPASAGWRAFTFFLRTAEPRDSGLSREVRDLVGRIDPELVVFRDGGLATTLELTYADARTYASSSMTFAAVALVLAAIGLYGVLTFTVGARTREIGVRIAVGADARRLVWMVLRGALATVLVGIVAGLGTAWYVSRFLQKWLYGVTPHNPAAFIGVAALFLLVGGLAAYVPARRATRVDPVVALRTE